MVSKFFLNLNILNIAELEALIEHGAFSHLYERNPVATSEDEQSE